MRMFKVLVVIGFVLCATNAWATPSSEFVPDVDTVALWHLNGNGDDASGNGNHLAVSTDRVSWVSGKFGQGAEMGDDPWSGGCFNSIGAALTAPGSGCTYPGSGDWTIEAWVLFPSNSGNYVAISHYSKHWAGHDPYHLYVNNGQAFFMLQDSSNNYIEISADVSAYVGQWVHLAGVYRYQQDVALYVNGVQVAYEATTLVVENLPSYDVFVGGNYCGTSTDLKVDEVRISNVARYPEPVLVVEIDIKPGSCPNPLNVKSKGVPVAILGSADFDVHDIDVATIQLAGVDPNRSNYENVARPLIDADGCECSTEEPDVYMDLTLKFNAQEIVGAIGPVADGDEVVLELTGLLYDGTPITGTDCIIIRAKGRK